MEIHKLLRTLEGQCPRILSLAVVNEFKNYTGSNFFRFYKKSDPIVLLISQGYVDE